MNLVVLKGRLVRDINLHFSNQGTAYTNFTVAVNRYSKDNNASEDFIFFTLLRKTAQLIAECFRKGQDIWLRGNIKTETLEKEGTKVYKQSVFVETVEFVGSKKENVENTETKEEAQDNEEFPW